MRNSLVKITGVGLFLAVTVPGFTQQAPATKPAEVQMAPSATNASADVQTIHILAGRSVILNSQARFKRILNSSPSILDTTTVSPTQVVISAKTAGTGSLVLWDETGHSRILDVSADVDVSALRNALQQALPSETVHAEADQGRVVLTGKASSQAVADSAVKLASLYSKEVVNSLVVQVAPRAKQIMLKVRFAEVDRSKSNQLGINIFSTGAANTIGTISTQQFSPPAFQGQASGNQSGPAGTVKQSATSIGVTDLLNLFVYRPDINLGATLRDLENKNVLQILAEPNLLARSGVPARFVAGGEFPYPTISGGGGVGSVPTVTITFRQFGVKLDFMGVVNPDNTISLKVTPEVSALDYSNSLTYNGFVIPAISTRRAETEVDLKDGQSFGIAGLLDHRTTVQLNKMPGFSEIPIIGMLFKSRNYQRSNTELMVIVTPTLVDPIENAGAPPETPKNPISFLDVPKYDESVGDKKKADAQVKAPEQK